MRKVALITGVTGQDGWYLARLLKDKGYIVHGTTTMNKPNAGELTYSVEANAFMHYMDLTDPVGIQHVIDMVEPDEIYNLAAQSHVGLSFDYPMYTYNVTGIGAASVFHAALQHQRKTGNEVRVYQASSSEMFGNARTSIQDEDTPFAPCSPYACAKVFAHNAAQTYSEAFDLFVCRGVLFNHESPRRGSGFVTQKVCRAAAKIKANQQDTLILGNLNSTRDWGYAGDYVKAMWAMMQQDTPDTFVIATGVEHSIQELLEAAFGCVDLDYTDYVQTSPEFMRANDVTHLCGDSEKARFTFGWEAEVSFESMVEHMVAAQVQALAREQ